MTEISGCKPVPTKLLRKVIFLIVLKNKKGRSAALWHEFHSEQLETKCSNICLPSGCKHTKLNFYSENGMQKQW